MFTSKCSFSPLINKLSVESNAHLISSIEYSLLLVTTINLSSTSFSLSITAYILPTQLDAGSSM